MRICEYRFNREDPSNLGYSILEVDYYAWIPQHKFPAVANHGLTLRKNLNTNEYEIFRRYYDNETQEVIAKTKIFTDILEHGNFQWNFYHSVWSKEHEHKDIPCDHKPRRDFCDKDRKDKR